MRLAFWTATLGCSLAFIGGVLAASLLVGFLAAVSGGLVVGGAALVAVAEFVLAPKSSPVRQRR